MALVALLGCGGRTNQMGSRASTDAGGTTDRDAGAATSGEADASSSSDAVAPVPCESTGVDAGAAPANDAEVPSNHRPTPACCPAERGPAPSGQPYPSDMATGGCSSDSECTAGANGRCFPFQGLIGLGGCSYDECFTDSNCGAKTPCLCRGSSADDTANACDVGGNCAVDSDCGPGGYCSPSAQNYVADLQARNVCFGSFLYFCHMASDLCINDSDCNPPDAGMGTPSPVPPFTCAYSAQNDRWECMKAVCALP